MVIANILGISFLFFLLWRLLKEDYHYEKIFNLGFLILPFYLVGLLITSYILKDFWFWIILVCISLGFIIIIKKQKMKFFEVFEAIVIGLLPWISIIFLSDSIDNSSLSSFLAFWMSLVCILLFFFLKSYYRNFTWYKSGMVGFAGLSTAAIFFLIRAISSLFFNNVISFAGKFEVYLSLTVAFFLFLLLYKLSRSNEY